MAESFSTVQDEAMNILLSRPGFHDDSVAIRKGPKQSSSAVNKTSDEVDMCMENFRRTLEFPKVRKQSNIGKADWVGNRGLAFITKTGKFFQTMGHRTPDNNNCLFPEETLYLLNSGDIELCLNDYPLPLSDAFTAICNSESPNQCTFEEYQVFTYLINLGFVVNRFVFDYSKEKEKIGPGMQTCLTEAIAEITQNTSEKSDKTNNCSMKKLYRNWWLKSNEDTDNSRTHLSQDISNDSIHVICETSATNVQSIKELCLHDNTNLKNENMNQMELVYSYSRKPDLKKCRENSTNWKEYKSNLENEIEAGNNKFKNLLTDMNNMQQIPLLHPLKANNLFQVMDTLKLTEEVIELPLAEECFLRIMYNVFKPQSLGFKKSFTGLPMARIVVVPASTDFPSLQIQSHLQSMSGDVPLVYAVVDNDQIAFYDINSYGIQVLM